MSFSISFDSGSPSSDYEDGYPRMMGTITIGAAVERFASVTAMWNQATYERQWRDAARRLLDEGVALLCTDFVADSDQSSCDLWYMYREEETVYIYNVFLLDELRPDTAFKDLYALIPLRSEVAGEDISEWTVPVGAVQAWLHSTSA